MMPKELRWQVWWVYEGAWWGLKSKMLVFHWFYHYFLKGQEGRGIQENKQPSSPDRLGGGRGRVNPPPCGLVWGFGGLEGLKLSECIYTPRGQRPRRILKSFHFPIDFDDFMYLWGHFDVTLGAIFLRIMEDNGRKVKNGPPKWQMDVEWHL